MPVEEFKNAGMNFALSLSAQRMFLTLYKCYWLQTALKPHSSLDQRYENTLRKFFCTAVFKIPVYISRPEGGALSGTPMLVISYLIRTRNSDTNLGRLLSSASLLTESLSSMHSWKTVW